MFAKTRVRGIAVPFHRTFEEVNLRFYVKRRVEGAELRAVTFIRELVPRAAIAVAARLAYNEPYRHLPMSHQLDASPSGPTRAEYRWTVDRMPSSIVAEGIGVGEVPSPDSEEAFMTQRHWGYTTQRDGSTVEYHVAHPAWSVRRIERGSIAGNPSVFGPEFAAVLAGPPASAFFADGSAVAVHDPMPASVATTGRGRPGPSIFERDSFGRIGGLNGSLAKHRRVVARLGAGPRVARHAIEGLAPDLRGKRPANFPHSTWELLDHIRATQRDLLEFCTNETTTIPSGPTTIGRPSMRLITTRVDGLHRGNSREGKALADFVTNDQRDLTTKIPHGPGATTPPHRAGRR